jgi:uncharacterized protein (DUF433 family)
LGLEVQGTIKAESSPGNIIPTYIIAQTVPKLSFMVSTLNQHIEIDPGIRGGKPRISGRRITVADIAIMHLKMGQSLSQISQEYELSLAALHAALSYYYDHQAEIEQSIEDANAFAEASREKSVSPLQQKLTALQKHDGSNSLPSG